MALLVMRLVVVLLPLDEVVVCVEGFGPVVVVVAPLVVVVVFVVDVAVLSTPIQ